MYAVNMDARDLEILANRQTALNEIQGPRVGDFVRFADGVERRVSYIWQDEDDTVLSVQTSDGGSYYLGDGYVSMSGGLHPGVKPETLTRSAGEFRSGSVWFFHHNMMRAHNGVDAYLEFRVFDCSEPAS